jgi:short-subunit dehydrogenase involved in D-alanine esterification of teichoic acids
MTALHSKGKPWRGRIVVVTGGTPGIGRAFVVRLAAEGAKVIACARNEMALRELQAQHPTIEVLRCDVTARMDVLALKEAILDCHGRVDVLINNAGIMEQLDLLDGSVGDERIVQEIAVNLTGPILLTRTLLPAAAADASGPFICGAPCCRDMRSR